MPNLAQLYGYCVRRSVGAVISDDIYSALNSAGFFVYSQVLKEQEGFFIKTDTTTVILQPASITDIEEQVYTLPADLGQLMWAGERLVTTPNVDWDEMTAVSLARSVQNLSDNFSDWYSDYWSGCSSAFSYYGPYLDAGNALDVPDVDSSMQIESIKVTPLVDQPRNVMLVYHAKWLTLIDSTSPLMMPEEGTYAMQFYAVAELLEGIDDTRSAMFQRRGDTHLASFLTWVRDRHQQQKTAEPYL